MRNRLFAAIAAAAISVFSAGSAFAADELQIGTIFPLTGPGAVTGTQQQRGVDLAIKHINAAGGVNGRMLKAVVEDSAGRPDQAVLAFNRMVELNNVPVVMTAYSSVGLAVAPLATRREVLAINSGAQSDALGDASPYLLNTLPLVRDEAPVMAQYAIKNIGKTAAILYENASAGESGRDDFKKSFEELGGKVLVEEPAEFGLTNYRPLLLKIMAAKPDVVYIAVTQNFNVIAEQVAQIDGFPKVVGNTFSTPFFGQPGAVGWYNTTVLSKSPPALEKEYKETYNDPLFEIQTREYYNSVNIIAQAMKRVLDEGKEVNGANLKAAIFDIGEFKSEIADISFTDSNTADREILIQQNGEKERTTIDFKPE